jgi:hypothetical protein
LIDNALKKQIVQGAKEMDKDLGGGSQQGK